MIAFENVNFSYGKKSVIRNLSFTAEAGECFAIAGENGVGKSTVLALAAGALKPRSGTIACDAPIGFIPQECALFPDLSVRDNLRFFAALRHVPVPQTFCLPIGDVLRKPVGKLSGGMQKRVSIVCADIGAPRLMILDEPCAGLDLNAQELLVQVIAQWKREGRCVLYTGHDPQELATVCDRLLFLEQDGAELLSDVVDWASEIRARLRRTAP